MKGLAVAAGGMVEATEKEWMGEYPNSWTGCDWLFIMFYGILTARGAGYRRRARTSDWLFKRIFFPQPGVHGVSTQKYIPATMM